MYNELDEEYAYWHHLYNICNVKEITYVVTTVDIKRIRGYWNSGLVASKRQRKIFSIWADNFKKVMRAGAVPKRGIFYVEQSSLAASVMAANASVYELPNSYNYPIHLHPLMYVSRRIEKLSGMVTAHYHNIFRRDKGYARQNPISAFMNSDEQSNWLIECLDATGVYASSYWRRLALSFRDRAVYRVRQFRGKSINGARYTIDI